MAHTRLSGSGRRAGRPADACLGRPASAFAGRAWTTAITGRSGHESLGGSDSDSSCSPTQSSRQHGLDACLLGRVGAPVMCGKCLSDVLETQPLLLGCMASRPVAPPEHGDRVLEGTPRRGWTSTIGARWRSGRQPPRRDSAAAGGVTSAATPRRADCVRRRLWQCTFQHRHVPPCPAPGATGACARPAHRRSSNGREADVRAAGDVDRRVRPCARARSRRRAVARSAPVPRS